jgi:adenylate cyclase
MMGEIERGKDWTQRALLLDPENLMVRYNVACSLTFRNSDLEGALELLDEYFKRIDSPGQIKHVEIDPDMDRIREDPRFVEMISAAKKRIGMPAAKADA